MRARNSVNNAVDAGVRAGEIVINVTEQVLVTGTLIADSLISINVTASTGAGAMVTYGAGINSFTADAGSGILTLNAGGRISIVTSHSIYSGAQIETLGNNTAITLNAGTDLTLAQGAVVRSMGNNGAIALTGGGAMHLNSGSTVLSGASFNVGDSAPTLTGSGATLALVSAGEMTLAGGLVAGGAMTLSSGDAASGHADYFDTLPGTTLAALADQSKYAGIIAALNGGTISAELLQLFTSAGLALDGTVAVTSVANYTPFSDLSDEAKDRVAVALGYTVIKGGAFYNPATGQLLTTLTEGPQVSAQTGYTMHNGLVFFNPAAAAGAQLVSGFVQGLSADYNNGRIDWAGAGVSAPAANTAFGQLSGAQKLVVANTLGYVFDYYGMPGQLWDGDPTISSDDIARPDADATYAQLTAQQKAIVIAYIDSGSGAKNYFNYNAAAGKKVVTTFTQGPLTDYSNANIYWGAAGQPAADASFDSLTLAQKKVVAVSLGYDSYDGTTYFNPAAAAGHQLVTQVATGAVAAFDIDDIDWGGVRPPAEHATFEQLTVEQRAIVAAGLGYDAVAQQVYYKAGGAATPATVVATLRQGAGLDYLNTALNWGSVDKPADNTGFDLLTLAQQNRVLEQLGYQRWDGLVYHDADAAAGKQYKLTFVEGSDYHNADIGWSEVAIPADGTAYADMTAEQQFRVRAQTGFTSVFGSNETVYYKAGAGTRSAVQSFTEGIDYSNSALGLGSAAGVDSDRWLVTVKSGAGAGAATTTYVVYAPNETGDAAPDRLLIQQPHPLLGQRGFGFLLTGTVYTLQDNADFVVGGSGDAIVIGNIHLLGCGADLVVQSDNFVYWQGSADVGGSITLQGGVALDGSNLNGANADGTSLYLHATSRLDTSAAGSSITLQGGRDVELHGTVTAGGAGAAGADATISVTAGQQILVDSALLASKSVTLTTTGATGADDNNYSVLMTAAGGLTALGNSSDLNGGLVSITTTGSITLAGNVRSGGASAIVNGDGIDMSSIEMRAGGQLYLGALVNVAGGATQAEIGAILRASQLIALHGGVSADGIGVKMPGGAGLATSNADGSIVITSAQDAQIMGVVVAGGAIVSSHDSRGELLGTRAVSGNGNSSIRIEADQQIRIGRDLIAGQLIDVRGGVGAGTPTALDPWADEGIVLNGNVHLKTLQENSVINLSSSGDMSVLTPAWTQQIEADSFAEFARGDLSADVAFLLTINLGTHTVSGLVTLRAADTLANAGPVNLAASLQAAIKAATFTVTVNGGLAGTPAVGSVVAVDTDTLKVRTNDNRMLLTSNYGFSLAAVAGGNAGLLGLTQLANSNPSAGATVSARDVAIDASARGSVANLGKANAPGGEITVSGWIRAHSGINLYAGTSASGRQDLTLTAGSVLEDAQRQHGAQPDRPCRAAGRPGRPRQLCRHHHQRGRYARAARQPDGTARHRGDGRARRAGRRGQHPQLRHRQIQFHRHQRPHPHHRPERRRHRQPDRRRQPVAEPAADRRHQRYTDCHRQRRPVEPPGADLVGPEHRPERCAEHQQRDAASLRPRSNADGQRQYRLARHRRRGRLDVGHGRRRPRPLQHPIVAAGCRPAPRPDGWRQHGHRQYGEPWRRRHAGRQHADQPQGRRRADAGAGCPPVDRSGPEPDRVARRQRGHRRHAARRRQLHRRRPRRQLRPVRVDRQGRHAGHPQHPRGVAGQ